MSSARLNSLKRATLDVADHASRGSPNPLSPRPHSGAISALSLITARTLFWLVVLATSSAAVHAQEEQADEPVSPGPPTGFSVTEHGTVRMHVADLPLSTALHLLSLEGRRNIITSPNVKGKVTANLYDVTFEEALHAILAANGADFLMDGNFIYVYTNKELKELATAAAAAPPPETRVYRLNYISANEASAYVGLILKNQSQEGEKSKGESRKIKDRIATPPAPSTGLKGDAKEGGSVANALQDFIIVSATPAVHEQIEALLAKLDVRPKQVLIEAAILRAELTDDNALGIDFSLVGGVDLGLLSPRSNGLVDLNLGILPEERYERFNSIATTSLASNIPDGGLTVGIIKDNVAIFLRALEEVTDTTVLANPKILALNRQKGQVIVGRRDGFMTTTVTETQAIQTVEFLETGTQLIFRPFIGDDGFIRVELHPEDSVGFVNAQGLPSEQTTEVTTNVIIRDGETILIGGLFREVTTDSRSQVPGLGNLPIVGALFKTNTEASSREEVIILLTIHIVKDREAYADASREQYDRIERMRVGTRKGLMWHGRERMAQAQYGHALEALDGGKHSKALWHLNMALHNNGRFLPAIQLKERILGQRAWDEDGTGGRTFLNSLMSKEKGYSTRPFGRPQPELGPPNDPPPATDDNSVSKSS